ncbi:globin [Teladorsagia circumcincta]|uniref:Globin n=1 Tax=Teladorsagia circumcincta TaxID=45464 RepID=A0A2G9V5K1_TELCI|nr:globin [Teladorsagia circumcincta]
MGSSAGAKQAPPPPDAPKGDADTPAAEAPTVDSRLPYPNFRELFTLKNYWKTIRRTEKESGKILLAKYLNQNPENASLYAKLKSIDAATVDPSCSNPGFEAVAGNYLKVFDDIISTVEERPGDVQQACDRLMAVGKMHRTKVSGMQNSAFQNMEEPFLNMVKEALQDRFNEKAEGLFRKFFQFCLKYLLEGFNG